MSTLLVLTVGQTDAQLVEGEARRELAKGSCASLHDEIERRGDEWQLLDSPASKLEPATDSLPSGAFALCTPKLDALLQYCAEKDITATAALILETRRDASAEPGDPRFAGEILAKRLRDAGITHVQKVTFLDGQERLEDRDQPRDAVIRREVVNRLDQAVRGSLATFHPRRVIVAATGGLPVVSNLVEEIVSLHTPLDVSVEPMEVADGAKASPPTGDRAVPRRRVPEPAVLYQARRHALELITKGNLLGAWGAVQYLHDDEVERRWTRVVQWLADFASSLPLPDDCDIDLLKHPRMAARMAIRVELALRAEDIPGAVQGTVAFFEAAFWDWLKEYDFKREAIVKINEVEYQLPQPSPDQKKRFRKKTHNGTWRIDDFRAGIRAWLPILDRSSLTALSHALTDDIRNVRHDVAHNEPTPQLITDARRRMVEAELWSDKDGFLTQSVVQDVLDELGVEHADRLCESLVATVRSRLVAEV